MKYYQFFCLVAFFLFSTSLQGQTGFSKDYQNALKFGAHAKLTLAVVDETGQPVSNATCRIGFNDIATSIDVATGVTDKKGIFIGKGRAKWYIGGTVKKEGFYTTTFTFLDGGKPGRVNNGRWLPWNPTIPVVLRKVQHPIPMYAMGVDFGKSFPRDEDIGFDCIARDWVAPHGSGKTADFMFRLTATDLPKETEEKLANLLERQKTSTDKSELANIWIELRRIDMAYYKLVLSAPDKDGGFIKKQKLQYSHFMSDHQAPQTGYSQCFTISMGKLPYFEPPNPNDLLGDEYLIFKSRIVRDETGTIISANYGKIYGPMVHSISRKEREREV